MSQSPVARRYAQALLQQAGETGVTERVDSDMDLLRQAMTDSRELVLFFESPVVSRDRKKVAITALLSDRVSALTLDLVKLLVDKGRESLVGEVVESYRLLRDTQLGIVEARVRTAKPLVAEDEKAVSDQLSKLTGKKVRIHKVVDSSLMGGVVVRVGDTVYDGSISNRLANLRERLMHGSSVN